MIDKADAPKIVRELEEGNFKRLWQAKRLAGWLSDPELLSVDPFQGDFTESIVLKNKIIDGRKPHVDHYSGWPIEIGERHRVIVERTEDNELCQTRHSRLSLWMMYNGGDPSCLTNRRENK